jgi:hypothetical protein
MSNSVEVRCSCGQPARYVITTKDGIELPPTCVRCTERAQSKITKPGQISTRELRK